MLGEESAAEGFTERLRQDWTALRREITRQTMVYEKFRDNIDAAPSAAMFVLGRHVPSYVWFTSEKAYARSVMGAEVYLMSH